ncbi:MAG: ATP-binding protein [Syntrophales bacterium LBB04]|nr:ATP-binding protein [Syntrophales bacterium LBB04]
MNELNFLQQSFDNFIKATASLEQAYANLEQKFESINRELEEKNLELEKTITANKEMENYLQNILESLTNGVVVTDLEGKIRTVNRCAEIFAEVKEADVKGRHISDLFDDVSAEKWGDIFFSKYFKGEVGYKIKLKGRTLEMFGSPVNSRSGDTLGTVFILRDITRIEKLEDMAKRKEKLASMGEMAANIAHEIRNPLGSIELFATLLIKDLKDEKDRDRVAKIVASVKNVDNKISNLLLFTKNQIPNSECLNVHDILKETLLFTESLASQGSISLTFKCSDSDAFILGDAEMLKQVFLNIILNAFQAMPEGGHLKIETRSPDVNQQNFTPFLEIIFSDDGIGIPEENIPKIFDPLFSTREGTSGLGLAIVHNIVDMHKGAINVERGKQGGTVFTLLLPLLKNKD